MTARQAGHDAPARQTPDLVGAVLAAAALAAALVLGVGPWAWLVAAAPMAMLGAFLPRVGSDRWWRLPVVSALALLPAGWAVGSGAPVVALTLLAALLGGTCLSAWLHGRAP